jgi:hypothetical protein
MSIRSAVVGFTSVVNPQQVASIEVSNGYTTGADGTQTPTYTTVTGLVDVQGLVEREYATLEHTAGFNMNAVNRKMFAYGSINMALRASGKGGDLIQLGVAPNITTWKVVRIFETWPDWCAVVIRQEL